MPLISRLIGSVAFLSMAVCSADAALRDQPGALDWQTFKVPEYGTRVDYPARIFAAVGGQRKALVSVSIAMMVGPPSRFMHARTRRATHRPVISEELTAVWPRLRTDHSLFLCDLHGTGGDDLLQPMQFFAFCPQRHTLFRLDLPPGREAGLGPCGDAHQSFTAAP
jgi:hypothetical protein